MSNTTNKNYLAADTVNGVYVCEPDTDKELLDDKMFYACLDDLTAEDGVIYGCVSDEMAEKIKNEYGII